MLRAGLLACVAVGAILAMAPMASAQTPPVIDVPADPQPFSFDRGRNLGVADRPRPDYDAQGLRLGSIILRPELAAEVGLDSNVFYQDANERDDTIVILRPRLAAQTDWSRHALRADIQLDDVRYSDNESEDHTDIRVSGEGRLDVRRGSYLLLGGRQERLTERRGAPDSPLTAAKPLRFEVRAAYAAGVYEFNRVRASLRLDRENLNYKDAPLIGGGVADQDQRDHTVTTATARLEYALSPDTALVGQVAANTRDYELKPPQAVFDRDSEGVSYQVGVNTDITNLIRGEVIVGYLYQDYDDPALQTARGLALNLNLDYFVTPLTTVSLRGARRVDETLTAAASAYVATEAELRVDHELRRNILLTAGVGVLDRDFEGASRQDEVLLADAGARFLLNRRIELGARWRYERQQSSGPVADPDYDVNRFTVSAALKF